MSEADDSSKAFTVSLLRYAVDEFAMHSRAMSESVADLLGCLQAGSANGDTDVAAAERVLVSMQAHDFFEQRLRQVLTLLEDEHATPEMVLRDEGGQGLLDQQRQSEAKADDRHGGSVELF